MIAVSLPFPPSSNNRMIAVRGRMAPSPTYAAWQRLAAQELALQVRGWDRASAVIPGPYDLALTADRPDRRARDLGNLFKATEDALVKAGVIKDDSLAQSVSARWSAAAPAKGARINITIIPCDEPA